MAWVICRPEHTGKSSEQWLMHQIAVNTEHLLEVESDRQLPEKSTATQALQAGAAKGMGVRTPGTRHHHHHHLYNYEPTWKVFWDRWMVFKVQDSKKGTNSSISKTSHPVVIWLLVPSPWPASPDFPSYDSYDSDIIFQTINFYYEASSAEGNVQTLSKAMYTGTEAEVANRLIESYWATDVGIRRSTEK
ncbi:hypothetical protein FIBSPDRAFT_904526 [Athelia psychrophila]|uniref:Uncharacterized protein n=1 Tax=Athelia psychrophila TaxID=1759441 RepID=A0A167UMG0_9AGAM|nr:hypothetical protein FIBSPDRAFT_904526 [Fibularhizoctonia sp. CBS 109695]